MIFAYGATGGTMFSTDIVETFGGFEQRNINWSEARGQWNVAHGVKTETQLATLIAFFRARRGKAIGFRFKDWSDYKVSNQILWHRQRHSNGFPAYQKLCFRLCHGGSYHKKPVAGTIQVFKDGVLQSSGYTANTIKIYLLWLYHSKSKSEISRFALADASVITGS